MKTTKSGYTLPPPGTIEAVIDGQRMTFPSEAALIAASRTAGFQPAPSPGNARVRRQRKRETALRLYFRMIKAGRPMWHRVKEIHDHAPRLTERIAKECGIDKLEI